MVRLIVISTKGTNYLSCKKTLEALSFLSKLNGATNDEHRFDRKIRDI